MAHCKSITGLPKKTMMTLVLCYLLGTSLNGQFDGLRSFSFDSVLRKQMADARVKSVTETLTEYKEPFFNGRLTFDSKGRTIEKVDRHGTGFKRSRTDYNSKGLMVKAIGYDEHDSSKVTYWTNFVYNAQGQLLKTLNGTIQNGKAVENVISESKYLPGTSKYRTEKQEFYGAKLNKTVITIDSVSGIYTYSITYEFRPGDVDEKGRRQGEKKLIRWYVKDSNRREDHIKYNVLGRLEMADEMKSYYQKLEGPGENSRELESGEIEYDEAYMSFLYKHPEEMGGFVSPEFIKALLAGEVKGETKVYGRNVYSLSGQLIEREYFGKKTRFSYNDKGQLAEQTDLSEQVTDLFSYDDKGLLIKKVSTEIRRGVAQHPRTMNYTYVFY